MAKKKSTNKKQSVKVIADINPQTSVDTKEVVVVNNQSLVARSPLELGWIEFKSGLITTDLIDTVKEQTEIVQTLLTTRRKIDIQIAKSLFTIRNLFLAHSLKNNLGKAEADDAFSEYVQAVFDIKGSRASEYIRVASKPQLAELKLPISSLCELARLDDQELEEFLIGWPPEEIATMPFKEVQLLVRDNNKNRKDRQSASEPKVESPDSSPSEDKVQNSMSNAGSSAITTKHPSNSNNEPESQEESEAATVSLASESKPTEQDLILLTANLRAAFNDLKPIIETIGLNEAATELMTEITQFFEQASKKGGA